MGALPLLLLLASCGGGSGGSGGSGGGSGGDNDISQQEPNPPSIYEPRPASWSVTQSTNTDDVITTQPYQRGGLDDGITISNGNKWSVDFRYFSPNNNPDSLDYDEKYNKSGFFNYEQFTDREIDISLDNHSRQQENRSALEQQGLFWENSPVGPHGNHPFEKKYYGMVAHRFLTEDTVFPTRLSIIGYMKEDSTNNNYLLMGYWGIESKGSRDLPYLNNYLLNDTTGMFVDGNDPFIQNNLQSLEISATYSGPIKTYVHERGYRRQDLYGNINLYVDFNNSETMGTVEGSIDNLGYWIGRSLNSVYSGRLNLERTNIGDSDNGFFTGTVSGTLGRTDPLDFNGKWGGRFYGNDRSDGLPESVAGTMSATSTNNQRTIMAPWIVDKVD